MRNSCVSGGCDWALELMVALLSLGCYLCKCLAKLRKKCISVRSIAEKVVALQTAKSPSKAAQ